MFSKVVRKRSGAKWHGKHRPYDGRPRSGAQKPYRARGQLLYGYHVIHTLLKQAAHSPGRGRRPTRELHRLFMQGGREETRQERTVYLAAEAAQVDVVRLPKAALNDMLGTRRTHNGFVLDAEPIEPVKATTDDILSRAGSHEVGGRCPLVIALDEIHDVQNLGGILRSVGYLFGDTVPILSSKNCAPLSPAASSASAGALEFLYAKGALLHAIKPLPTVLKELRGSGFQIIGTGYDDKGVMRPLETLSLDGPMCIVMGNEHRGMRTNISRECDEHVFIGRADSAPEELDSLNVSAAATVFLSRLSDHGA